MGWLQGASLLLNFATVVLAPVVIVYAVTAFTISHKKGMPSGIVALAILLSVASAAHTLYSAEHSNAFELIHDAAMLAAMVILLFGLRDYIHSATGKGGRKRWIA